MILKEIEFEDWQSFKGHHSYTVPEGLIFVQGVNLDREGAKSNRAGKTSFVNTIPFCLFGRSPLISKKQDFINDQSESSWVKLHFESMSLTRYLNDPKHSNLTKIDGKGTEKLFGPEKNISQEDINSLIGMEFDSFSSVIFFGTGYSGFLEKVLTKPVEAKEFLTSILPKLKTFDYAWLWIKKQLEIIEETGIKIDREIELIKGKIQAIEGINYDQKINQWYRDRDDKINNIKWMIIDEQEKIKGKKRLTQNTNSEIECKKKRMENLSTALHKLRIEINSINGQVKNIHKEREEIKIHLSSIKKEKCPYCDQYLPSSEEFKKKEQKRDTQLLYLWGEKEKELNASQISEKTMASEIQSLAGELLDLEQTQGINEHIENLKSKIIEENKSTNPFEKEKDESVEKLLEWKLELSKLEKQKSQVISNKSYYDFWYKGFGSKGIKNFVFDELVFSLTEYSEEYIQYLTKDSIKIKFDPRRQKKRGGFVENIELEISGPRGPRPWFTWSKSERKIISLGVGISLNKMISEMFKNALNISIFDDESFDGLDPTGTEIFCSLLERETKRIRTIFLITNSISTEEIPYQSVTIKKRNGISSIYKGG